MSREAVLLLNHFLDRHLVELYAQLVRDCAGKRDVWLLSDRSQRSLPVARLPANRKEVVFTVRDLEALGYAGKQDLCLMKKGARNLKLGNAELPVLLFAKSHPEYDRYWVVEYDVRFSGSWDDFFSACSASPADLLATTITRHYDHLDWPHWPSVKLPSLNVSASAWLRGFFPIYRLSRAAAQCIDASYRAGAEGHMESLVPTLVYHGGLMVEDLGGDGEFVPEGNRNRFYTNNPKDNSYSPGTFVYRPVMTEAGSQPKTLWHPVKPHKPRWLTLAERSWSRGFNWIEAKLGIERAGRS